MKNLLGGKVASLLQAAAALVLVAAASPAAEAHGQMAVSSLLFPYGTAISDFPTGFR